MQWHLNLATCFLMLCAVVVYGLLKGWFALPSGGAPQSSAPGGADDCADVIAALKKRIAQLERLLLDAQSATIVAGGDRDAHELTTRELDDELAACMAELEARKRENAALAASLRACRGELDACRRSLAACSARLASLTAPPARDCRLDEALGLLI